jgi:chromosome partitioning protein
MKIYAMINQKGGVGKTTTAINLGAALAAQGKKVLVVDIDPQANATSSLGFSKYEINQGVYQVMIGGVKASQAVQTLPEFSLSILPSSPELSGAEIELIDVDQRETVLKEALEEVSQSYDYILIDCPPSLSLLTINALVAAKDGVIIPVQCEYLALEGLGQLISTIARVQKSFPGVQIRGVLLTMYDGRTRLAGDVVNEVRKYCPDKVFEVIIPRSVRLAEAPSYGQPINVYSRESNAAKAYEMLADEIIKQDTGQTESSKEINYGRTA